jgi:hypothetical protein
MIFSSELPTAEAANPLKLASPLRTGADRLPPSHGSRHSRESGQRYKEGNVTVAANLVFGFNATKTHRIG